MSISEHPDGTTVYITKALDEMGNGLEKEKILLCRLCYEQTIETVIVPCGHACMCSQCGEKWKQSCSAKKDIK